MKLKTFTIQKVAHVFQIETKELTLTFPDNEMMRDLYGLHYPIQKHNEEKMRPFRKQLHHQYQSSIEMLHDLNKQRACDDRLEEMYRYGKEWNAFLQYAMTLFVEEK